MAVAHHLLTVIYHMLRDSQPYQEPGAAYYDQKRKPEITKRLVQRLQRLGYQVTLEVPLSPAEIQEIASATAELPPPEYSSH